MFKVVATTNTLLSRRPASDFLKKESKVLYCRIFTLKT